MPSFISKSSLFFQDSLWKDYNRIYYKSKSPVNDRIVEEETEYLVQLTNQYPDVLVVGHSLGAWWASHLACHTQSTIKKLALWTPLGIARNFPIFKITEKGECFNKISNLHNVGPDKTFIAYAKYDWIVPYRNHTLPLIDKFQATSISLNGGHAWQSDHKNGLLTLKKWFKS